MQVLEIENIEALRAEGSKKISYNNKYSAKLSYKRMLDVKLAGQVCDYLAEKNIFLPKTELEFNKNINSILCDKETGEILIDEYLNLAKMVYDFRRHNKAFYHHFTNPETGAKKSQLVTTWYSTHRASYVWCWKKSKMIRKLWSNFMADTHIYEKYTATHLVLTVPHEGGVWENKKFYAKELLKSFNLIRKSEPWKEMIYGGEYGLEIKKSKNGNGLHIHLHCLIFQHKKFTVNEARQMIGFEWFMETGGSIHYETLYTYKKDTSGKYETKVIPQWDYYIDNEHHREEEKIVKVKYYLDDSYEWFNVLTPEQKEKEYINGVMECIKYHFKPDWCEMEDGNFDIELIQEVLNSSKGMRFYSKFGAFYGEERLNYDSLKPNDEEQSEIEFGDSSKIVTINPFTFLPAERHEYHVVMAIPEKKIHKKSTDINSPNEPILIKNQTYYEVMPNLGIKDIIRYASKGQIQMMLTPESLNQYINEHLPVSSTKNLYNIYEHQAKTHFYQSFVNNMYDN